jgi:hypothetical protein
MAKLALDLVTVMTMDPPTISASPTAAAPICQECRLSAKASSKITLGPGVLVTVGEGLAVGVGVGVRVGVAVREAVALAVAVAVAVGVAGGVAVAGISVGVGVAEGRTGAQALPRQARMMKRRHAGRTVTKDS